MEIKLWTAYIANGILIIIGLLILIRAVFCSGPKRKRFLIIMTALLTLSEIFDILYWVFEDKTQDITTDRVFTFGYTASFLTLHWLFACRYWYVSRLMLDRKKRVNVGNTRMCIFYLI